VEIVKNKTKKGMIMYASNKLMKLIPITKIEPENLTIQDLLTMTQQDLFVYLLRNIPGMKRVGKTLVLIPEKNEGVKFRPLLCAHLDTVSHRQPKSSEIVELNDTLHLAAKTHKDVRCLGADDRAGVYILLQIIMDEDTRNKYSYCFFKDEEIGCVGSGAFINTPEYEDLVAETSCFIGVDRSCVQGVPEYATYDCDDFKLEQELEKQLPEFKSKYGSISDCAVLSNGSSVPCFNLTAGYKNEHTRGETLYLPNMIHTMEALKLLDIPDKQYEYEDIPYYNWRGGYEYSQGYSEPVVCDTCGIHAALYEDYNTGGLLCGTCMDDGNYELMKEDM